MILSFFFNIFTTYQVRRVECVHVNVVEVCQVVSGDIIETLQEIVNTRHDRLETGNTEVTEKMVSEQNKPNKNKTKIENLSNYQLDAQDKTKEIERS